MSVRVGIVRIWVGIVRIWVGIVRVWVSRHGFWCGGGVLVEDREVGIGVRKSDLGRAARYSSDGLFDQDCGG